MPSSKIPSTCLQIVYLSVSAAINPILALSIPPSGDYHIFHRFLSGKLLSYMFIDLVEGYRHRYTHMYPPTHTYMLKDSLWEPLPPSTMWVPGINLRLWDLISRVYTQWTASQPNLSNLTVFTRSLHKISQVQSWPWYFPFQFNRKFPRVGLGNIV